MFEPAGVPEPPAGVVVAMRLPFGSTATKEPAAVPARYESVVEALNMPPCVKPMTVEVELPHEAGVNGNTPDPPDIAPHCMTPLEVVSALEPEQLPSAVVMVPVLSIWKRVVVAVGVEEPMAKRVLRVSFWFACMESAAKGELVPIPTKF